MSKLRGSVVLPSYQVMRINAKTDNAGAVNKPFAFKIVHSNMRTYYLAADTEADMLKWMNALNLATALQKRPG